MKKIKIMFTAIGVLAIVGGALALNASRVNGLKFCTGPSGSSVCPNGIQNRTFTSGTNVKYVQVSDLNLCTDDTPCSLSGNIQREQ
ncbi:hypothetical protein F0L74_21485 [Chitinophaga agrisoli]|uniref:Uncharacterized protein n=1 Tax=Chitinophaga agrisoli TaxID=2607653 RepID=A0A5B2VI81_9BACT|nr:hypothetical protein [Chitinophaga agrisoli]KAA2238791.1 hypothetical protein F0L74_21485 [Chitinophaga agrisoli]